MSDREIMNSKSSNKKVMMTFRDPVVQRVCEKFTQRSDEGFKKYGRTLSDEMLGDINILTVISTIYKKNLWTRYCIYKQLVN